MAESLGEAILDLRANDAGLKRSFTDAKTGALSIDDAFGKVSLSSGLATLGIAATATAVIGLGRDALNTAGRLTDTAAAVGLNVESLQEYEFAADQAGVTTEQLHGALSVFTRNLGDAANGTGKLYAGLRQTNPELLELLQNAASTEEALDISFHALANTADATERAALANELFGRSGQALLPMLAQGKASLDEMRQRARELGLVIGEDLVKAGDEAGDKLAELSGVIKTNLNAAFLEAAPLITDVAESLTELAKDGVGMWKSLSDKAFDFFDSLEKMAKIQAEFGFMDGLEKANKALDEARENYATLLDVVERGVGKGTDAWATLTGQMREAAAEVERLEDLLGVTNSTLDRGKESAKGVKDELAGAAGAANTLFKETLQIVDDLELQLEALGDDPIPISVQANIDSLKATRDKIIETIEDPKSSPEIIAKALIQKAQIDEEIRSKLPDDVQLEIGMEVDSAPARAEIAGLSQEVKEKFITADLHFESAFARDEYLRLQGAIADDPAEAELDLDTSRAEEQFDAFRFGYVRTITVGLDTSSFQEKLDSLLGAGESQLETLQREALAAAADIRKGMYGSAGNPFAAELERQAKELEKIAAQAGQAIREEERLSREAEANEGRRHSERESRDTERHSASMASWSRIEQRLAYLGGAIDGLSSETRRFYLGFSAGVYIPSDESNRLAFKVSTSG